MSHIWWGHGVLYGSFVPEFDFGGLTYMPFAVWTNGYVNIYFQYFRRKPPFESEQKRLELLALLNSFLPKKLPVEVINKQPGISMADICEGRDVTSISESIRLVYRRNQEEESQVDLEMHSPTGCSRISPYVF